MGILDVLLLYKISTMHKEAIEQEHAYKVVKARRGIREALQKQATLTVRHSLEFTCNQATREALSPSSLRQEFQLAH